MWEDISANVMTDAQTCWWFEFGDRGARWDAQRRTVGAANRSEDISEEKKKKDSWRKDYSCRKDILVVKIILHKMYGPGREKVQSNLG